MRYLQLQLVKLKLGVLFEWQANGVCALAAGSGKCSFSEIVDTSSTDLVHVATLGCTHTHTPMSLPETASTL